jgi:dihydrofolate reductase
MRKVILGVAVSLDSFIEGPKGEYDWCFTDQDYGLSDFFKRVDTAFIGRKTYEMTLSMNDSSNVSHQPTHMHIADHRSGFFQFCGRSSARFFTS